MTFSEAEQARIDAGRCPYCNRPFHQDMIDTGGMRPQLIPGRQRCLYDDCRGTKGRYQGPVDD